MTAVALLSGGQDSTTCLAWALREFTEVKTVSFAYGQRHRTELEQAKKIAKIFDVSNEVLPVEALRVLGGAALTNPRIEVEAEATEFSQNQHAFTHQLPSTFVPGRNVLFLGLAAAYGAKFGFYDLVTGVCEQDRSGYPDCRTEFIVAMEHTLTTALDEQVSIHAPLLNRSKADTWALAKELDILDLIVRETHTCYHGNRTSMWDWGAGCGKCPACVERANGFYRFMQVEVA